MNKRSITTSAVLLSLFALVGTLLVALTWNNTHELIREQERKKFIRDLNSLLPSNEYDNAIFRDVVEHRSPTLLGTDEAVPVYRARKNGQPIAVFFTVIAPDGYNGDIKLLVGIRHNGTLAGVRVISHKETPGLGDKIDVRKSPWIKTQLDGKSLSNPVKRRWKVKKDGGSFDQFTGATITPRAVIKAVRKALEFYQQNRRLLYRPGKTGNRSKTKAPVETRPEPAGADNGTGTP